jgi:hypothetical protein
MRGGLRHGIFLIVRAAVMTFAIPALAFAQWSQDPANNLLVPGLGYGDWAIADSLGGVIASEHVPGVGIVQGDFRAQRIGGNGTIEWGSGVELAHSIGIGSSHTLYSVPDGHGGAFFIMKLFFGGVPNGYAFWLQHYDASGTLLNGPFGVPFPSTGSPREPLALTPDGHGGGLLIWYAYPLPSDLLTLRALRFDSTGAEVWTSGGVRIGAMPLAPAQAVADGFGGAIVARGGYDSVTGDVAIFAHRVDADGNAPWGSDGVSITTGSGDRDQFQLVSDGDGGVVIVWQDHRSGVPGRIDLYAQRIDATGTCRWAANGLPISSSHGEQSHPVAVADGAGGMIVAWQDSTDRSDGDLFDFDLVIQRVDSLGALVWGNDGRILCDLPGRQTEPVACSDQEAGAIIAWTDSRPGTSGSDVYAQRVDHDGERQWIGQGAPVAAAAGDQHGPLLIPTTPGEGIVVLKGPGQQIFAQRIPTSDLVATLGSLVSADAGEHAVRLRWQIESVSVLGLTIERSAPGGTWRELAPVFADGTGFVTFEDHDVTSGGRFGYRLASAAPVATFGEVWVDVPTIVEFSLQGARPNPTPGAMTVSFGLQSAGAARLELFDMAGRSVRAREWDAPEAGTHVVEFASAPSLAPGLYFLRLSQGGRTATARVTVIR